MVTARGNPSGIATTIMAIDMINASRISVQIGLESLKVIVRGRHPGFG